MLLEDEVVVFICDGDELDREKLLVDGDDLKDELDEDEREGLDDLEEDELELDELLASTGIGKLHNRKPIIVNCVNLFNIVYFS